MKKTLSVLIITTLVLGSIFAAPKKAPSFEPIEIDYVNVENELATFMNYPPAEVVGIIGRFAESRYFTGYYNGEGNYTEEIDTLFAKFKDHKAVTMAKQFESRGIDSDALLSLAYHIKPDFSGTIVNFDPFPETLDQKWKKIRTKEIYNFISAIYDFAAKSPYTRYVLLRRGSILESAGYYNKHCEEYKFFPWFDSFFKKADYDKLVIDVTPVTAAFYFYDTAKDAQGKTTAYITLFPNGSTIYLWQVIVTQNIQKLCEENWDAVKDNYTQFLHDTIYAKMPKEDADKLFKDNPITVNDMSSFLGSFLFLDFFRYPGYIEKADTDDSPYTFDMAYNASEKSISAHYFYDIMALVDDYSSNLDKYKSFDEYFPKFVEYLKVISFKPANVGE